MNVAIELLKQECACTVCDGAGVVAGKRFIFFGKLKVFQCAHCQGSGIDPKKKKKYRNALKRMRKASGL